MKRSDITTVDVIEACHKAHNDPMYRNMRSFDVLKLKYKGYPDKVVFSAMMREDDRGFLNYGVSLNTAWVEDLRRLD